MDIKQLKKDVNLTKIDIDEMSFDELKLYIHKAYKIDYYYGLEIAKKIRELQENNL